MVLTVMNTFGPLLAVPIALLDTRKPDLPRLVVVMILVFTAALRLLTRTDLTIIRYLVSIMALFLLTSLLLGLRYKGHVRPRMLYGICALSDLSGEFLRMPGPHVIFFYLSGPYSVTAMLVMMLLFLLTFDAVFCSRL